MATDRKGLIVVSIRRNTSRLEIPVAPPFTDTKKNEETVKSPHSVIRLGSEYSSLLV